MKLLQYSKKILQILNFIKNNWKIYLKELLPIVIKNIILFIVCFFTICILLYLFTPQYPLKQIQPIFRYVDPYLTAYILSPTVKQSICNTDEEYIKNTNFLKRQICELNHQYLIPTSAQQSKVIIKPLESRRIRICWLKLNFLQDVCQQLYVKNNQAIIQKVDIRTIQIIQITLITQENSIKKLQVTPDVFIYMNINIISYWIHKSYSLILFYLSGLISFLISGIKFIYDVNNIVKRNVKH